jgi:hypothetical protein
MHCLFGTFFCPFPILDDNLMENQELFWLEIDEFNRSHHNDPKLTQNLDNFIEYVAKTGVYLFPWHKIKKLYIVKMESVIDHFNHISNMDVLSPIPNFEHVKFNELKERLSERMNSFTRYTIDV